MSNLRNYTLLPSSSLIVHNDACSDVEEVDTMGTSEESTGSVGYAVDDLQGKTAVEVKTALINRALEETGMGKYQWCMYVLPSILLLSFVAVATPAVSLPTAHLL